MQISASEDTPRDRQARNLLFEKAVSEEKKGNFKKALEHYKMALQIDAQFFDAWLNAGAIYSRDGKSDKAIVCYQRAIVSKTDNRALYNLASEYFKTGKYEEARVQLQQILKTDQRFIQSHLLLGYVYGKLQQNDKAEISIKNVLKIDPNNQPAMTALALLYFHSGKKELALRLINVILAKNPEDRVMQRLKAAFHIENNDIKAAAIAMKVIARRDPTLKIFYGSLREGLHDEQRKEIMGKKKQLDAKKQKNEKDLFDLSILHFFEGDPEQAMDFLQQAADLRTPKKK